MSETITKTPENVPETGGIITDYDLKLNREKELFITELKAEIMRKYVLKYYIVEKFRAEKGFALLGSGQYTKLYEITKEINFDQFVVLIKCILSFIDGNIAKELRKSLEKGNQDNFLEENSIANSDSDLQKQLTGLYLGENEFSKAITIVSELSVYKDFYKNNKGKSDIALDFYKNYMREFFYSIRKSFKTGKEKQYIGRFSELHDLLDDRNFCLENFLECCKKSSKSLLSKSLLSKSLLSKSLSKIIKNFFEKYIGIKAAVDNIEGVSTKENFIEEACKAFKNLAKSDKNNDTEDMNQLYALFEMAVKEKLKFVKFTDWPENICDNSEVLKKFALEQGEMVEKAKENNEKNNMTEQKGEKKGIAERIADCIVFEQNSRLESLFKEKINKLKEDIKGFNIDGLNKAKEQLNIAKGLCGKNEWIENLQREIKEIICNKAKEESDRISNELITQIQGGTKVEDYNYIEAIKKAENRLKEINDKLSKSVLTLTEAQKNRITQLVQKGYEAVVLNVLGTNEIISSEQSLKKLEIFQSFNKSFSEKYSELSELNLLNEPNYSYKSEGKSETKGDFNTTKDGDSGFTSIDSTKYVDNTTTNKQLVDEVVKVTIKNLNDELNMTANANYEKIIEKLVKLYEISSSLRLKNIKETDKFKKILIDACDKYYNDETSKLSSLYEILKTDDLRKIYFDNMSNTRKQAIYSELEKQEQDKKQDKKQDSEVKKFFENNYGAKEEKIKEILGTNSLTKIAEYSDKTVGRINLGVKYLGKILDLIENAKGRNKTYEEVIKENNNSVYNLLKRISIETIAELTDKSAKCFAMLMIAGDKVCGCLDAVKKLLYLKPEAFDENTINYMIQESCFNANKYPEWLEYKNRIKFRDKLAQNKNQNKNIEKINEELEELNEGIVAYIGSDVKEAENYINDFKNNVVDENKYKKYNANAKVQEVKSFISNLSKAEEKYENITDEINNSKIIAINSLGYEILADNLYNKNGKGGQSLADIGLSLLELGEKENKNENDMFPAKTPKKSEKEKNNEIQSELATNLLKAILKNKGIDKLKDTGILKNILKHYKKINSSSIKPDEVQKLLQYVNNRKNKFGVDDIYNLLNVIPSYTYIGSNEVVNNFWSIAMEKAGQKAASIFGLLHKKLKIKDNTFIKNNREKFKKYFNQVAEDKDTRVKDIYDYVVDDETNIVYLPQKSLNTLVSNEIGNCKSGIQIDTVNKITRLYNYKKSGSVSAEKNTNQHQLDEDAVNNMRGMLSIEWTGYDNIDNGVNKNKSSNDFCYDNKTKETYKFIKDNLKNLVEDQKISTSAMKFMLQMSENPEEKDKLSLDEILIMTKAHKDMINAESSKMIIKRLGDLLLDKASDYSKLDYSEKNKEKIKSIFVDLYFKLSPIEYDEEKGKDYDKDYDIDQQVKAVISWIIKNYPEEYKDRYDRIFSYSSVNMDKIDISDTNNTETSNTEKEEVKENVTKKNVTEDKVKLGTCICMEYVRIFAQYVAGKDKNKKSNEYNKGIIDNAMHASFVERMGTTNAQDNIQSIQTCIGRKLSRACLGMQNMDVKDNYKSCVSENDPFWKRFVYFFPNLVQNIANNGPVNTYKYYISDGKTSSYGVWLLAYLDSDVELVSTQEAAKEFCDSSRRECNKLENEKISLGAQFIISLIAGVVTASLFQIPFLIFPKILLIFEIILSVAAIVAFGVVVYFAWQKVNEYNKKRTDKIDIYKSLMRTCENELVDLKKNLKNYIQVKNDKDSIRSSQELVSELLVNTKTEEDKTANSSYQLILKEEDKKELLGSDENKKYGKEIIEKLKTKLDTKLESVTKTVTNDRNDENSKMFTELGKTLKEKVSQLVISNI